VSFSIRLEVHWILQWWATILFHDLAEKKLVTFDEENNEFVVKIKNNEYKFKPKDKQYVHNAKPNKRNLSMMDDEIILVETVSNTETMFMDRQQ